MQALRARSGGLSLHARKNSVWIDPSGPNRDMDETFPPEVPVVDFFLGDKLIALIGKT